MHRKYNTDTGLENFILRLKENNPNLSYYSNYINSESKVTIKCDKCGNIFERYASCVRQNKVIRCYECEKVETKKKKEYIRKQNMTKKELYNKADKLLKNKQIILAVCVQCGNLFIGSTKYCSKKCRDKYHNSTHTEIRNRYKKIMEI